MEGHQKWTLFFSLLNTHLYILFLNKPKKEPPSYKINLHLFKSFYVQKAPYKAVDDLDLSILVIFTIPLRFLSATELGWVTRIIFVSYI